MRADASASRRSSASRAALFMTTGRTRAVVLQPSRCTGEPQLQVVTVASDRSASVSIAGPRVGEAGIDRRASGGRR